MATSGALGIREKATLEVTIELLERTLGRLERAPEYARERAQQKRETQPDMPPYIGLAIELGTMEALTDIAAIEVRAALESLKELRDGLAGGGID